MNISDLTQRDLESLEQFFRIVNNYENMHKLWEGKMKKQRSLPNIRRPLSKR